jgi:hypothetical protein
MCIYCWLKFVTEVFIIYFSYAQEEQPNLNELRNVTLWQAFMTWSNFRNFWKTDFFQFSKPLMLSHNLYRYVQRVTWCTQYLLELSLTGLCYRLGFRLTACLRQNGIGLSHCLYRSNEGARSTVHICILTNQFVMQWQDHSTTWRLNDLASLSYQSCTDKSYHGCRIFII